MTQTVEFCFDLISPPSYLAYTQLPAIAAQAGAQIVWRPVLVGAIHKATGNRAPIEVPAKGKYLMADLARYAARYRVPFRLNPHFPFSTLAHQRMATGLLMRQPESFAAYIEAMFAAIWVEGLNLTDPAVIAQVIARAGLDAPAVMALAEDVQVKDALREATESAVARGAFGVPTFFVGEQMFWGQDRLDFVREALSATA
jgi:2-hydroxychromene-2-carboxylate isomerase